MRRMSVAWPWCSLGFATSVIEWRRRIGNKKSDPQVAFFVERLRGVQRSVLKTARAAVTVAARSSSLCAALTKPASYKAGAM